MQDKKALFQTFSDARLIEVVKNAKQFGYDDNIRNIALEVLKERDISENDLYLTGNLSNHKFDHSRDLFRSYEIASKISFIAYFVSLLFYAISVFHLFGIDEPGVFLSILYWLSFIIFLIALTKSFFDHSNFYKSVGKELGSGDQIIFFVVGMPFYIFMYFFYKSRMKEELLMIK